MSEPIRNRCLPSYAFHYVASSMQMEAEHFDPYYVSQAASCYGVLYSNGLQIRVDVDDVWQARRQAPPAHR